MLMLYFVFQSFFLISIQIFGFLLKSFYILITKTLTIRLYQMISSPKHEPRGSLYPVKNRNLYPRFSSKNAFTSHNSTIREKSDSRASSQSNHITKPNDQRPTSSPKQCYKTVIFKKKTQFSKQYQSQKAIKFKRSETVYLGQSAYSRQHHKCNNIQYIPNEISKQYKYKALKRHQKNNAILWNESPSTLAYVSEKYTIQRSQRFNHFSIYYRDKYQQKNDEEIIKMPFRILQDFKKELNDVNKQVKSRQRCKKTMVNIHKNSIKKEIPNKNTYSILANGQRKNKQSSYHAQNIQNKQLGKQNCPIETNQQIKQLVNQRNTKFIKQFCQRYNLTDEKSIKGYSPKIDSEVNNTFHQTAIMQSINHSRKSKKKLIRGGSVRNMSNMDYKSNFSGKQLAQKHQRNIKSYLLVKKNKESFNKKSQNNKKQNQLFLESIFNAIISQQIQGISKRNTQQQNKQTIKLSKRNESSFMNKEIMPNQCLANRVQQQTEFNEKFYKDIQQKEYLS